MSRDLPELTDEQVETFLADGVVEISRVFSAQVARDAREILWRDTGSDPDDPRTWTKPVVRLGMYDQAPFVEAANTPILIRAFDRLVGAGRWLPRTSLGTFPVRFPSPDEPGDDGWHVDPGFDFDKPDFLEWRTNVGSTGRCLLMLFLFSDVGEADAPTRLRLGSHIDVARRLAPAGEQGLTLRDLASSGFSETAVRREVHATGAVGTVFLCHPFLVHAAQKHRGTRPRFIAQPPLLPAEPLQLTRADGAYSPVEEAIRRAIRSRDSRVPERRARGHQKAVLIG